MGQVVTILSQPFWCWQNEATLSGTYVVAVSTFNHTNDYTTSTAPSPTTTTTGELAPMALLGSVPLHAFLP